MKTSKNSIRIFSSFILIGVVVVLWHFKVEPFYKFSLLFNDFKYTFNQHTPSDEIVFLSIDEKSITQFGRWPWDRELLASKLTKLKYAKAVALDMVFSESTTKSKDQLLANKIEDLDNIVCGIFLRNDSTKIFNLDKEKILEESSLQRIFVQESPFLNFRDAETNINEIAQKCAFSGVFSTISDSDALLRKYPIGFLYNNYTYPSLGIQLLRFAYNKDILIKQIKSNYDITFDNKKITIDNNGFSQLNYYPYSSYKIISFADFTQDSFDTNLIKDKIVILGISEAGISDMRATPLGQIPGPLLHYTFISNYIQNILLHSNYNLELGLIIFFSIIPIFLHGMLQSLNYRIVLYLLSIGSIVAISLCSYIYFNLWLDSFYILFGYLVLLVFNGVFLFKTKDLETQFIKNAFNNYLSSNLLNQIIQNPSKLKLGGEKKRVSILFTDIRGFTNLSESISSEKLIQILELYFTPMTKIVLRNNGTLDKYIGDAIMAFYNAPIDVENHEQCAVKTALQMLDELQNVNKELTKRGLPNIDFGAGINTGDAIVGNIGSMERFDYSVIGDSVNVASRVEGLCKQYKAHILITEFTKNALNEEDFLIREIDEVSVRGKHTATKLYQVLPNTSENQKLKKLYDEALEQLANNNTQIAKDILNKCFIGYNDETAKIIIEKRIL